jgi:hypothetical protein
VSGIGGSRYLVELGDLGIEVDVGVGGFITLAVHRPSGPFKTIQATALTSK